MDDKKQLYLEYEKRLSQVNSLAQDYLMSPVIKKIGDIFISAVNKAISFEDSRSHIQVISTNFNFIVSKEEITYTYKHEKKNRYNEKIIEVYPEQYNFIINRINNLKSDIECDALAEALIQYLSNEFYANNIASKVVHSRNDNEVNMTFTVVNKDYIASVNL